MKTHKICQIVMILALLLGARSYGQDGAKSTSIKNETLEVRVDAAAGTFSLTELAGGKTFVKDGKLSGKGGTAKIVEGQGLSVTYPDGSGDSIVLKPGQPFAFFSTIMNNSGSEPITKNRVTALTAPLDLGAPEKLRVLGTGGLSAIQNGALKAITEAQSQRANAKAQTGNPKGKKKKGAGANTATAPTAAATPTPKPLEEPITVGIPKTQPGDEFGSYVWMAVAEPESRNGVVGAWLTEDRASGVVFPRIGADGKITLEAQLHYGALHMAKGAQITGETFALGYFADARLGLEQWADALANHYNVKLPPQPVGFCTWYTEKFGKASDEVHLAELAKVAAEKLKPWGFNFIQIDDQWQLGNSQKNGPKKNFTAFDPAGPYPAGMKATAEMITKLGMTPGIWFMPFAGTYNDPYWADKQDMFYKTADGKPFDTRWGGTCLDMSNPKSQAYLRDEVKRLSSEWGYKIFKMDGMYTGTGAMLTYKNDGYKEDNLGSTVLFNPEMTNIEAYRKGIQTVREAAGSDVFLLGCCVPQNMRSFCGGLGLVDAFRIGPDTGSGRIGSPHATRQYFLNGRVWYNDPDCVTVRARNPLGMSQANASFAAISGNLFYDSDWIPDLPADRIEILKRTMLPHGLKTVRPVDIFERGQARIWTLSDERSGTRRDVVALFNWDTANEATIACSLEHLGLDAKQKYVAFDFWANRMIGTVTENLEAKVPADSCVVLALRPAADHPQLLSTSAHVTQGIVDVLEEKWNSGSSTLSGKSKVVADDPYELRIAVPEGFKVSTAKAGGSAGPMPVKEEAGLVRASFTSAAGGEVDWSVEFKK